MLHKAGLFLNAIIYLFKVNNVNTECVKSAHWRHRGVFNDNFEQTSQADCIIRTLYH